MAKNDLKTLLERASGSTMTRPDVTLAGSGAELLLGQYHGVLNAADKLLAALESAAPHPRDFVNTDRWRSAMADHDRVVKAVSAIHGAYEPLSELAFSRIPVEKPRSVAEKPVVPAPTAKNDLNLPGTIHVLLPVYIATKPGEPSRLVTDKKAALKDKWRVGYELMGPGTYQLVARTPEGAGTYDGPLEDITVEQINQLRSMGAIK